MSIATTPAYFKEPIIIHNVNDLFTLYSQLIQPVQEYEATAYRKSQAESTLAQARETVSSAWIMPFATSIALSVVLAIPFAILFVIAGNVMTNEEGIKLISLFDKWLGDLWIIEQITNFLSPDNFPLWSAIIILPLFLLIEYLIAPTVIFLFPTLFILNVFTTIFSTRKAKQTIIDKEQEIVHLQDELDIRLDDLSLPISFVPPNYRYSQALEYFCYCYANGKATTLQEAVNAYDTYLHQQRMEQGQQQILATQDIILQKIRYQNIELSQLNDSINRLHNKVDWLDF